MENFQPLAPVELLDGADQADRALLDEVEEGQALVAVALGDRDHEAQVRAHHVVLRREVAALDALGQLDLFLAGQQRGLGDAVEKLLKRVDSGVRRRLGGQGFRAHGGQPTTGVLKRS